MKQKKTQNSCILKQSKNIIKKLLKFQVFFVLYFFYYGVDQEYLAKRTHTFLDIYIVDCCIVSLYIFLLHKYIDEHFEDQEYQVFSYIESFIRGCIQGWIYLILTRLMNQFNEIYFLLI